MCFGFVGRLLSRTSIYLCPLPVRPAVAVLLRLHPARRSGETPEGSLLAAARFARFCPPRGQVA